MRHEEEDPLAVAQPTEVAEATSRSFREITGVLQDTRQLFKTSSPAERDDQDEIRAYLRRTDNLESLSDTELVTLLLRKERSDSSVLEIARKLTSEMSSLAAVRLPGDVLLRRLGRTNAGTLLAAVELGRRLARVEVANGNLLERPEAVAAYLTFRYARSDQEVMGALFCNARRRLIAEREIYRGTLSRAAVEPRTILKTALLLESRGFILFHTHPSGDPSPSDADLSFTQRMAEASAFLGVRLLDHLILGGGRWVSLLRQGAC